MRPGEVRLPREGVIGGPSEDSRLALPQETFGCGVMRRNQDFCNKPDPLKFGSVFCAEDRCETWFITWGTPADIEWCDLTFPSEGNRLPGLLDHLLPNAAKARRYISDRISPALTCDWARCLRLEVSHISNCNLNLEAKEHTRRPEVHTRRRILASIELRPSSTPK